MTAAVMIGVVRSIDPTDWTIRFMIKDLYDSFDEDKFPMAIPIFHHVMEINVGDEVYIIKNSNLLDRAFYYIPVTLYKFVGIKNKFNFIDITNEGILDLETRNFYAHADVFSAVLSHEVHVNDTDDLYVNNINIQIPNNQSPVQYFTNMYTESKRKVEEVYKAPSGWYKMNIQGYREVIIANNSGTEYADYLHVVGNSMTNIEGHENLMTSTGRDEVVTGDLNEQYDTHVYNSLSRDENVSNHIISEAVNGAIIFNSQSNDVQLQSTTKLHLVGKGIFETANLLFEIVQGKVYATYNGEIEIKFLDWAYSFQGIKLIFTHGRLTSIATGACEAPGTLNAEVLQGMAQWYQQSQASGTVKPPSSGSSSGSSSSSSHSGTSSGHRP